MNEIEKKNDSNDLISYDNKQIELIRTSFASGATDAEFDLFLYFSKKYNLDILTKQLFFVKYDNKKASIFAGRDGFLSIAHRSKKFDSMETDIGKDGLGIFAICKVYRTDMSRPFVVKVWLHEYVQKYGQWPKMPYTMLGKTSESQCLRKAFDISGLYDQNEIPDTRQEKDITPTNSKPATNTPADVATNDSPAPTPKIENPTFENFKKWYSQHAGAELKETLKIVQSEIDPPMTPEQIYEAFKVRKFDIGLVHSNLLKLLESEPEPETVQPEEEAIDREKKQPNLQY